MKEFTDHTATVAALQALMLAYNKVCDDKTGKPGQVLGGQIAREHHACGAGIYTELMDCSMTFIASWGNHMIAHADLLMHLYRIAHQSYSLRYPERIKSIEFSEEQVNERFKDVSVVFTPLNPMHALITYKASVPMGAISGPHLITEMRDKLRVCYAV